MLQFSSNGSGNSRLSSNVRLDCSDCDRFAGCLFKRGSRSYETHTSTLAHPHADFRRDGNDDGGTTVDRLLIMSRKDYELIARAFRDTVERHIGDLSSAQAAALRLAEALHKDNPRFDRQKFIEACGF